MLVREGFQCKGGGVRFFTILPLSVLKRTGKLLFIHPCPISPLFFRTLPRVCWFKTVYSTCRERDPKLKGSMASETACLSSEVNMKNFQNTSESKGQQWQVVVRGRLPGEQLLHQPDLRDLPPLSLQPKSGAELTFY